MLSDEDVTGHWLQMFVISNDANSGRKKRAADPTCTDAISDACDPLDAGSTDPTNQPTSVSSICILITPSVHAKTSYADTLVVLMNSNLN